jgi:D-amino-acid dehydrogenase
MRESAKVLHSLAVETLSSLHELVDAGVVEGVSRKGILYLHGNTRTLSGSIEDANGSDNGDGVEVVSRKDVSGFIGVEHHDFVGGLYFPREAHCEPVAFTDSLGRGAENRGARVMFGEHVVSIRPSPGSVEVVLRSGGSVRAGAAVLCAGTASRELMAPLGVALPLLPGRGYAVDIDASAPSDTPIYLHDERVVMTPMTGGTRLSGTLELVPDDHPHDSRRIAAVRRSGSAVGIPSPASVKAVRAGLRPCLPDGLPAIGPVAGVPNVFVATGHAMLGLTLSLATADIIRSAVDGEPRNEVFRLAPDRFGRSRGHRKSPAMYRNEERWVE